MDTERTCDEPFMEQKHQDPCDPTQRKSQVYFIKNDNMATREGGFKYRASMGTRLSTEVEVETKQ